VEHCLCHSIFSIFLKYLCLNIKTLKKKKEEAGTLVPELHLGPAWILCRLVECPCVATALVFLTHWFIKMNINIYMARKIYRHPNWVIVMRVHHLGRIEFFVILNTCYRSMSQMDNLLTFSRWLIYRSMPKCHIAITRAATQQGIGIIKANGLRHQ
jgi:hypothetical protein